MQKNSNPRQPTLERRYNPADRGKTWMVSRWNAQQLKSCHCSWKVRTKDSYLDIRNMWLPLAQGSGWLKNLYDLNELVCRPTPSDGPACFFQLWRNIDTFWDLGWLSVDISRFSWDPKSDPLLSCMTFSTGKKLYSSGYAIHLQPLRRHGEVS